MAFDGLVIANLAHELKSALCGGRINKIYQPENDALVLTIKNNRNNYRLLLSASASLPLVYLTEESQNNPLTAPNFCMLLRKHLSGGKILDIVQPEMERILRFEIEHLDEMGDICTKHLIVELMGKHSNIIFTQTDGTIIDSIKHISLNVSSVREVLPGRAYFIPKTSEKLDPTTVTQKEFMDYVLTRPYAVSKSIYTSLTGFSPLSALELCYRAGIDGDRSTDTLSEKDMNALYDAFGALMDQIKRGEFTPNIVYRNDEPIEFSCIPLTCYGNLKPESFETMSALLENYYAMKNKITRIRQKSADLRRIVTTALDRSRKKYYLQLKQMEDTAKRDKYKVYGELINTYGYGLEPEAKSLTCLNYYTNEEITIPLDPQLSAKENAVKYFDRYNKLKRTYEALETLTIETKEEMDHLESISTALDIALYEEDLAQLKEELVEYGYIKRHSTGGKNQRKPRITSQPFHYVSSDGYDMYVGKNNFQNEELTFKVAAGNDWWFHAKGIPGSHVIVKCGNDELPDATFEEAGALAAYYSKNRDADKVEIDYIQRKHVKKVSGGKPGFVIYHTNYSLICSPIIQHIRQIN